MSTCIKLLFEYDLIKKCSNCEKKSLKSNFHKNKTENDELHSHCNSCRVKKRKIHLILKLEKKKQNILPD